MISATYECVTGTPLLHHKNSNYDFFKTYYKTMFMLLIAASIVNIMSFWSNQPSDTKGNPERWVNGVGKVERLNMDRMQNYNRSIY